MIEFCDFPESVEGFLKKVKEDLEKIASNEIGDVDIEFAFVDPDTIAKMNTEYRSKEGPTDVLTFVYGYDETEEEIENEVMNTEEPYAEGYLCVDVIKENSEKFNVPFEKELLTVLVHSILHMAGYDHEYSTENAEEMFNKQNKYVEEIWNSLALR
uniref:Endoribonuclease YbeY n=1 Tax=Fervidobacterium nodosum TaxID=2424 RepID=A0A7C5YE73_9BACT